MRMRASRADLASQPARQEGPLFYFEHKFNKNAAKILPGEYLVTGEDLLLVTILGSCVAACIWDDQRQIGGMNHFLLPDTEAAGAVSESARYGGFAMEILVNELLKAGASRRDLQAKVFGGGNVLQAFTKTAVGTRNAEFVREYLAAEKIPVIAEDLEGIHPRKVHFFPQSGRVMVKRLPHAHETAVVQEEKAYCSRLASQQVTGDVELFD